jgi:hypothetical protein
MYISSSIFFDTNFMYLYIFDNYRAYKEFGNLDLAMVLWCETQATFNSWQIQLTYIFFL